MQARLLMILSAILLGVFGLFFRFLPEFALSIVGMPLSTPVDHIMQFLGALYIAFALMNWAGREHLVAGIIGRTLATGNFAHFFLGTLLLMRELRVSPLPFWELAAICVYVILAVFFGRILFTQQFQESQSRGEWFTRIRRLAAIRHFKEYACGTRV